MPLVFLVALPFIASVARGPAAVERAQSGIDAGRPRRAGLRDPGSLVLPDCRQRPRDPAADRVAAGARPRISCSGMDGFAWLFCMLVLGIGALVVLYARYYMSSSDPVPRFFSFFLAFMGAMMGVVLSGNLVQMVLFWELTSLFSFLLIGYWHHRRDARRGARMALTVTGAGGLCLLAGVLLLGHIVGSYDLDVVLAAGDQIRAHRALSRRAGAGAAGRLHQERAVSLPFLAAARDGGADAGLGLPAFGDDGEGRRVPAGAAVAGAVGHGAMVLAGERRRRHHAAARRLRRDVPARPEGAAGLLDDQPSRASSRCCWASTARWRPSPRCSTS